VSGFIVPQLQLFLPNHIVMETRFLSEVVGTHQTNALAVANSEADVATNNSADFERFKLRFPAETQRLQVLWESELIPHAQIVVRREYPAALRTPCAGLPGQLRPRQGAARRRRARGAQVAARPGRLRGGRQHVAPTRGQAGLPTRTPERRDRPVGERRRACKPGCSASTTAMPSRSAC
jgi:hypothetical protein